MRDMQHRGYRLGHSCFGETQQCGPRETGRGGLRQAGVDLATDEPIRGDGVAASARRSELPGARFGVASLTVG
jgi:hypothetical protein